MRIFYSSAAGRADVPCSAPVDDSLDTALAVFRGLDARRGFLGVALDDRFHLQVLRERQGVRVELLDSKIPALDACVADSDFAESLIRAAALGHDVFELARAGHYEWKHTDL